MTGSALQDHVLVQAGVTVLPGVLHVSGTGHGLVILARSGGWPRNLGESPVMAFLRSRGFGTLHVDLVEADPRTGSQGAAAGSSIDALTRRLLGVVDWVRGTPATQHLHLGLCGTGVTAAAALGMAAERPGAVDAVVSYAGRPDLAGAALQHVVTPTLLIVGEGDAGLLRLSRTALRSLRGPRAMRVVPGVTAQLDDGAAPHVARLTGAWFHRHLRC
jgi:hypothetical protein